MKIKKKIPKTIIIILIIVVVWVACILDINVWSHLKGANVWRDVFLAAAITFSLIYHK